MIMAMMMAMMRAIVQHDALAQCSFISFHTSYACLQNFREQIYLNTMDALVTELFCVTVSRLVSLMLSLCNTAHAPLVGTQCFCIELPMQALPGP